MGANDYRVGNGKSGRREFISTALLSLAAINLNPSDVNSTGPFSTVVTSGKGAVNPFKTAARLEMLPGKNITEKVSNAERFGFSGISLPGRYLKSYQTELMEVFHDLPLPLVSMSLGYEGSLVSMDGNVREICRNSIVNLMVLCNELNITRLNVVPVFIQDHPEKAETSELDDLLASQLFAICEKGKENGVFLMIEPVNRYETKYISKLSHAVRICKAVRHDYLGVTADFYHMMMEELHPAVSLNEAGDFIMHVHVAENTRVEPGPGIMDFRPGFSALKKLEYNGFFEIECRSLSGNPDVVYPDSIRYLKEIWNTV